MSEDFEWVFEKSRGFTRVPLALPERPKEGEVLVRLKWVGICGSDFCNMEVHETSMRPGHEWLGVIESAGPGTPLKPGDTVTSTATFGCLRCAPCLEGLTNLCEQGVHLGSDRLGALRTRMIAPAGNLVQVPGPLSRAQVLHEVLAVAQESVALLDAHRGPRGQELLILGGGPVGLSLAWVAADHGYRPWIIEKSKQRVEAVKKTHIPAVTLAEALIDPRYSRKSRIVVDASSDFNQDTGAFKHLPLFLSQDFLALILGKYVTPPVLPRPFFRMNGHMIWMRGTSRRTLEKSVEHWNSRLDPLSEALISNVFQAQDVPAAFELARKKTESMKVVVEF